MEEEFVDAWTVQAGHQIPSSSKAPASATAHSREEGKEMDLQGITRWHRRTPPAAKPPRPEDVMPHADAHGRTNREQKHKRPTKPPSALHADGDLVWKKWGKIASVEKTFISDSFSGS